MASNLPRSCFRTLADLMVLLRVLGWQAPGYEDWLRCGVSSLSNLRPGKFIFFACYATAALMPPVSSFLLTLLEFYRLQRQHLSSHSFILVVIFVHFYEMFVAVWPSIPPSRCSTCCVGPGRGQTRSAPTTSSSDPGDQLHILWQSAPASGTVGGRTGRSWGPLGVFVTPYFFVKK
jgi:hypothetical protein